MTDTIYTGSSLTISLLHYLQYEDVNVYEAQLEHMQGSK
jgi:hypothetical protein